MAIELARSGFPIAPSDSVPLPAGTSAGIYVGTTGNVQVTLYSGAVVLLNAVPVGILHVLATKVWSTNTTASNMVGLTE